MHFSPRPNRAAEIRWRPWGPEAFAEAKAQGKPVLLGISAVWCHWCHVMDETSYSDDDVIRLINERFVPIRVDNDRRPDVNARYNMGGWPTTVFLTPEGEILYGGTYLPAEMLRSVLRQVSDFYGDPSNRLALSKRISELTSQGAAQPRGSQPAALDLDLPNRVLGGLERSFDDEYGGFGEEPKFPQTNVLHFLLDHFARTKDERAALLVRKTLHGMAGGGMYDHVEGGFFRYSTTRDWSVPHFEKMLEDLAGLLLACARASAMFDDAELARVAADVKRYVDATLWNDRFGGYGGSQDADEEYYRLDAAARAQRARPYVDPTLYASWNAEMARALIIGGYLLGGDARSWVERGLQVLSTLWSSLLVDGLMARYFDGAPHVRGLLGDQAWSALAAQAAFSASGDALWLERAGELIGAADALFDTVSGAYLDRPPDAEQPGRLGQPSAPLEENAIMALALLAQAAFTKDAALDERARTVLSQYATASASPVSFVAGYASAVLETVDPPVDIHIVGDQALAKTRELREAALAVSSPPIRVDAVDPQHDAARARELAYESTAEPRAYLCRGTSCFAKVTAPEELAERLRAAPVG